MAEQRSIVIIGGGVIGLTTAYFLSKVGVQPVVLDKGEPGQESSWAGAGIIPPGDEAHERSPSGIFRAISANLFPELSSELRERTGIDNDYVVNGGIELPEESLAAHEDEWRSPGTPYRELNTRELKSLEPAIASQLSKGTEIPGMAQVRNPRHLQAVVAACQLNGVELCPGRALTGFLRKGSRIAAVHTLAGTIEADRFLLTAGAWTSQVAAELGWQPGIRPVRGQIVLLNPGRLLFRHTLLAGSRYLVPRLDGRVLIGSTEEDVGFAKQTTAEAVTELLELACRLVPELGQAAVERCWAGLRPGSIDGLPYIGAVPGFENLFVAAGHFRAGIQLSPATGMVMKQLLLGEPVTAPIDDFRPDRAVRPSPSRTH